MNTGIDEAKQAIRRRIWDLLVQEGVVERGVHGYIPAFVGAATAADRLAGLPEWRAVSSDRSNSGRWSHGFLKH